MGSKSPSDVGSAFGSSEPQAQTSSASDGLCNTCQRPTSKIETGIPLCTCSTPQQVSEAENFAIKKKKSYKKPTILSRRQLFKEDESCQIEHVVVSLERDNECIPNFLLTCPVCQEEFFSSDNLSHHLDTHKTPPPLFTSSPSTSAALPPIIPTVSTSTRKSSINLDRPFICDNCSKAFSSKFKLMRHVLIHSDQRQYRCTSCEKTFHRKDHLKNHIKVHNPVKRRYKCEKEDCGKEYSSILSFKKHNAVHSVEEGSLDCKICGCEFSCKEDIVNHLKIHSGSRTIKTPADRKYRCEHCDRSFFTGKDVRRHMVVHTGRRDFLCQFCPQRFGRKDHLTRHIKKSHNNSSKKSKMKKISGVQKAKPATGVLVPYLKPEPDVQLESNIEVDPLRADVQESCREAMSSVGVYYDEPKIENVTSEQTTEQGLLYVAVPSMYNEATPGPSSRLVPTEHVFEDPHFQVFPEQSIKLEDTDFPNDATEGLTSLIELLPIMSGSEIDPLASVPSPFLDTGNEPRNFLNLNTHEFLSMYMDPSDQTRNITPLPRFSQAFHVQQHQPQEQEPLIPVSEHSNDDLNPSGPNSN